MLNLQRRNAPTGATLLGKRSGELLARVKKTDVIDAALVLLSTDGDAIATSDPEDLKPLAHAPGRVIDLIPV